MASLRGLKGKREKGKSAFMGHHNNKERASVKVDLGWPTVVQAHVKQPTLGKHQGLSVNRGARQGFHEAADFTLWATHA